MTGFTLDRLVCEVTVLPARPDYRWYEIDLDAPAPPAGHGRRPDGVNVIAATRGHRAADIGPLLRGRGDDLVTHLQFEAPEPAAARDVVRLARGYGWLPLPARHLDAPPRHRDELTDVAYRLVELGGPIVKVVYPVRGPADLAVGLDALRGWPSGQPALSLTPAGCRQARLAAALAGSALVYAPPAATADRMPARWWRELVTPAGAPSSAPDRVEV